MYLNLMRSDARDCGNPARSFVDSSSEGDAVHDRKQEGLVHEKQRVIVPRLAARKVRTAPIKRMLCF